MAAKTPEQEIARLKEANKKLRARVSELASANLRGIDACQEMNSRMAEMGKALDLKEKLIQRYYGMWMKASDEAHQLRQEEWEREQAQDHGPVPPRTRCH